MSTRWYPIYQKGNPQLRVFLPNFWMKLVRPQHKQPPNIVQFISSIEMTDYDIKNYLEKIYKIPVVHVKSEIVEGELRRVKVKGYIVKDDDYRRVFVTLKEGEKFEFPKLDVKRKEKEDAELKYMEDNLKEANKNRHKKVKSSIGIPGWFGI